MRSLFKRFGCCHYDKINLTVNSGTKHEYPVMIRAYACDMLWGYALYSGLALFSNDATDEHIISLKVILPAALLVVILETAQLSPKMPGTFDALDIVLEIAAIMLDAFITTFLIRRKRNESKVNP